MKTCFSNATVCWNEQEIARRESLIREIPLLLQNTWQALNPAVRMERCETPVLVPADRLKSHIEAKFELIGPCGQRGYLRPETTAGTFEAMAMRWENDAQLRKRLPFCMWQVGLSFRDEQNAETMRASKLRLVQFYQMEFQLFASADSKAPYLDEALHALCLRYGGWQVPVDEPAELPHYSSRTIDWYMAGKDGNLEVAGCSQRNDWPHGTVFEIAIGLDRLVALQLAGTA